MSDTIDQYTRRPARYEHLDGTNELGFGIWLLVFALGMRLNEGVAVTWRWFAMVYATIGAVWAIVHFGTRFIRSRLVYPRSGYVALPARRPWKRVLVALVAGGLAAAYGLWLVRGPRGLSAPLSTALIFGLALLIGALIHRLPKYVLHAILSFGIGIVLQFVQPAFVAGSSWYYLLMGIAFLASGGFTLYRYVRRTPRRNPELEQ